MRKPVLSIAILCIVALLATACSRPADAPSASAGAQEQSTAQPPAAQPAADLPDPVSSPPAASSMAMPEAAQGKRSAGEENAPVLAWRAFGTEPFWNARVDGDTLVFTTPDNLSGTPMRGRALPSTAGFVFAGKDGRADFKLSIRPGECSDGMSDNRYEYTSTFVHRGTTYEGCAEAAK